jgi:outer membrane autotransporter protein
VQFAYQRLELDNFVDEVSSVSAVDADGLRARAALQLFRTPSDWLGLSNASPYLEIGGQRDFKDAEAITVGSTAIREAVPETTGDVSVGFMGSLRSGLELHLDVRYQQSTEGEKDGVRANFGFRMTF